MIESDLNMIRKIAWNYCMTNPTYEIDDLIGEGCVAYMTAIREWDCAKSARTTFLWTSISNHLNYIIQKDRNHYQKLIKMPAEEEGSKIEFYLADYSADPCRILSLRDAYDKMLASLSPPAKAIWRIVLEQQDLFLDPTRPKAAKGLIKQQMRKEGWSWGNIEQGLRELRGYCGITA